MTEMTGNAAVDGVRAWRVGVGVTPPPAPPAAWESPPGRGALSAARREREARAWEALRRDNPRVHDGRILRATSFDVAGGGVRFGLAGDSYREFAVQERLLEEDWRVRPPSEEERFDPSLIWILGVKGWIVARDGRGEEHVLIARRGAQTRIYGMGWECAPAGGIDVAEGHAGELPVAGTAFDLAGAIERTLREEAREELGMDLEAMARRAEGGGEAGAARSLARLVVVVQDGVARSFDLFAMVELPGVIDPRKSPVCFTSGDRWEYVDAAWLSRSDAAGFVRTGAVTPPSVAAMRAMGWVGAG